MLTLKMPQISFPGEGKDPRQAPSGFGWVMIFEVAPSELHIWNTDSAFARAHMMSAEHDIHRLWVSSLVFNPEEQTFRLYKFLSDKRGVKVNGHVVTNMPFETLAFWANENLGIPGLSDFGEIFYNNEPARR